MKSIARMLVAMAVLAGTSSAWAHPVVTGHTHSESIHSRAPQGRIHTASARR